jgi:hypothetical protein
MWAARPAHQRGKHRMVSTRAVGSDEQRELAAAIEFEKVGPLPVFNVFNGDLWGEPNSRSAYRHEANLHRSLVKISRSATPIVQTYLAP